MEDVKADRVIDARGSYCPGPLMELIKAIREEDVGKVIEVWSSDESSAKDIPEWVKKAGHELIGVFEADGYWRIVVKKTK
ncbi:sulfurtransferase TusA family protein [Geoglobus sp.]